VEKHEDDESCCRQSVGAAGLKGQRSRGLGAQPSCYGRDVSFEAVESIAQLIEDSHRVVADRLHLRGGRSRLVAQNSVRFQASVVYQSPEHNTTASQPTQPNLVFLRKKKMLSY